MTEKQLAEIALQYTLEGDDLFGRIKKDIDGFIKKYNIDWLPTSQISTIQEILLSGERGAVMERLHQYRYLQLNRTSEKDMWQKDKEGVKAIKYFVDIIENLAEKHSGLVRKKIEEDLRLIFDDDRKDEIFKATLSIFTHIFVTTLRTEEEERKCLRS